MKDISHSMVIPQKDEELFVKSVILSSNIEDVKVFVEGVIGSKSLKSYEEQVVLNYDSLFLDDEFGPEAHHSPIFFAGDIKSETLEEMEFSLRKI